MPLRRPSRPRLARLVLTVALLAAGAACRAPSAPTLTPPPADTPAPAPTARAPEPARRLAHEGLDRFDSVIYSPDGRYLAAGAFTEIHLWDASDHTHLHVIEHPHAAETLSFCPDGELLAAGGVSGGWVISSAADGEQRLRNNYSMHIKAVAFLPDGESLVTGSWDKHVRLWRLEDSEEIAAFEHGDWVVSLAVSPDGTLVAAGASDGTVRVWNIAEQRLLYDLKAHQSYADAVAFSPDGEVLASGGWSGLRLYRSADGAEILPDGPHTGDGTNVHSLAYSPDGSLLAVARRDDVVLWDTRSWQIVRTLESLTAEGEPNWTTGVAFSPDGTALAVAHRAEGVISVWDITVPDA